MIASRSKVEILISRKTRSQTPDLIRLAPNDNVAKLVQNIKSIMADRVCRERVITVHKDANETLGMSVAGGVGAQRGNTPIYISNIYHKGCLGRTGHIQKGDVLLSINSTNLVGLTHAEAVTVLKASAESKVISLKIIEGSETTDGMKNFVPSWTFWLSLPKCGDQLLSVNGNSLQNLTHYEAVQILKDVRNSATLVVISWPGSLH
ncbi:PREDICTED: ligand of Numb protein X 2-like [Priapulus caudatus]|uniref:Ligand of Numb protein X 2-like n=1 Tax=Priapulus caudatus TaxID=37621 RepID=A0ABM1EEL2_PRICU|nr:PREDICTED: ligand of Numb protein X 2-like [Priapulus caudatus]